MTTDVKTVVANNDEFPVPEQNKECVFPFQYDGIQFFKCTNYYSCSTCFWCGTQYNVTKAAGWGLCRFDCPKIGDIYGLNVGAVCNLGYSPITKSWQHCKEAAERLEFTGDIVAHVDYEHNWGTTRPSGCFQSGANNKFYFNKGKGGNAVGRDKIVCQVHCASLFRDARYRFLVEHVGVESKNLSKREVSSVKVTPGCTLIAYGYLNLQYWLFSAYTDISWLGLTRGNNDGMASCQCHCDMKKECTIGYCEERYPETIRKTISEVETDCKANSKCKAFDYTPVGSYGHFCKTDRFQSRVHYGYRFCSVPQDVAFPEINGNWEPWQSWSECQSTKSGIQRRRFRDCSSRTCSGVPSAKSGIIFLECPLYVANCQISRLLDIEKCPSYDCNDDSPQLCAGIPTLDVDDFCILTFHKSNCKKTCGRCEHCRSDQYKCGDGFCINRTSLNDGKPDCINFQDEKTPEGITMESSNATTDQLLIGDLGNQQDKQSKPAHLERWGQCTLCCGQGTQTREGELLSTSLHGGSKKSGLPRVQSRTCNTFSCGENCEANHGSFENIIHADGKYKWDSASNASEACLKESNCCGITFSRGSWTLRSGAVITPISDAYSIRKDCFKITGVCRDARSWCELTKKMPNFKTGFCSSNSHFCLKSCSRC